VKRDQNTDSHQGWRPPTRRAFVAMLGAAAAALALRDKPRAADPRSPAFTGPNGKTRWIGHC
jgi:mono/diheme cytochrome c family protein